MKALVWAALDTLSCLLLVVLAAINPPPQKTSSAIETYGRYAIVITWDARLDDDVDLWVRDPNGSLVWWSQPRAGLMHLEQDDLGLRSDDYSGVVVRGNRERVVLRGIVPGEYVANLHAYQFRSEGSARVRVELWRLQGADALVYSRETELIQTGQEKTALRFTLDRAGRVHDLNRLQMQLVSPGD